MKCNIALIKKIGEGGEGAAYKIKLKTNQFRDNSNLACKEFNYTSHDGNP